MSPKYLLSSLSLMLLMGLTGATTSAAYTVDHSQSIFTIITHKAGIGSGLAHDHVIFAQNPAVELSYDPANLAAASFKLTFPVKSLKVDDAATTKKWFPRIKELKILADEPKPVSEGDIESITKDMLADEQLDADKHPTITATLKGLTPSTTAPGFDHTATVDVTIKGKTVTKTFPAKITLRADGISVSSFGEMKFTEFGIEPVSLFFGAIRNDDLFHVLVEFVANK